MYGVTIMNQSHERSEEEISGGQEESDTVDEFRPYLRVYRSACSSRAIETPTSERKFEHGEPRLSYSSFGL
jgi:hypothetical protein